MSIRVAFARNPPDAFSNCANFPTITPTINCPFPGWCVEIMKMVADSLNLDIDPILVNNNVGSLNWGTLEKNGSWTGVLGYLANGTADTACLFYQSTELRERYFELSYPVTSMAWEVIQLQLDEKSENMMFHTFAGNGILFMFSLLQSAFFTYLYEGLLLSALLQQGEENPFKDADGVITLIGQGKYHLVTNYRGNWYFDETDNSNSSHFTKLRAAISSNPVVVVNSVSDALDLVEKGNYVFPIQEDSLAMQMSRERCNLVYVSKGLPQRSAHLTFTNNSRFLKNFNTGIILQSQFIQRTFKKYFTEGFKLAKIPKCPLTEFEEGSKSLDVNSMIGIFTVGVIGMSFAIAGFVAEFYHFWHRNVLRRKWKSDAIGGVQNILAVANVHFDASHSDRFNMIKLAEYRQKIGDCRTSSKEKSTDSSIIF